MRLTHALFAMLALSACAPAATSATPQKAAPGYPVTITNCGRPYTFTAPPRRTVLMSGGAVGQVSALLALGLDKHVAGNAQSYGASDVPGRQEAIDRLPKVKIQQGGFDIPRETMLSLRPDFVIGTTSYDFDPQNGYATREELKAVGANSWLPDSTCGKTGTINGTQTIEDSYAMLRDFGKIYGVGAKAEQLVAESKRRIAAIADKVRDAPKPKVMYIIPGMNMGSAEFSSIGGNGIWNDIFAKAGAVNAFHGQEVFLNLSKEQVAKTDVDAVVIVNWRNPDPDAEARKLFAEFPQWGKKYVVLTDSAYLGPDNAVAVERIARMLHPDRF